MPLRSFITTVVLTASAAGVSAQTMKPGLWEITSQVQGGSGASANAMAEVQKQLANLPPDQRKMMQDMMAKQGVQMGTAPSGGMAVKLCMTQEMVDRNEVATQQGDCTQTTAPRVGNTMQFSFVCTKPPGSGEGQITFASPEAYTMKMVVTSTAKGKAETMDMQGSGRWLTKDCGNIKPLVMPKK